MTDIYGPIQDLHPPIQNKYYKWYMNICRSRQYRSKKKGDGLSKHHIIPDSFYIERTRNKTCNDGWLFGSPNTKINIVYLTQREHLLCHWLLIKIYKDLPYIKMVYALNMMCSGSTRNSRFYQYIRGLFMVQMTGENNSSWKGGHGELICPICNIVFPTRRSRLSISKYCSRGCTFKGRKTMIVSSETRRKLGKKAEKPYSLISPNNVIYQGINLKAFCKIHGLDRGTMSKVNVGKIRQHKGWMKYYFLV